jgi:hypothetical protein
MKTNLLVYCLIIILPIKGLKAQYQVAKKAELDQIDYVTAFKDTLNNLADKSGNKLFKIHCNSMVSVINSKGSLSDKDLTSIKNVYDAFNNYSDPSNAKKLSTYLNRERPLILSWVSPTDGTTSLSLLTLPKNWDPKKKYPLYIRLHGYYDGYTEPIDFMMIPYLNAVSNSFAFEDGYFLMPWGRGNLWYKGISETDIWECKATLEKIVKIDSYRNYLFGFSMGGLGAWSIAGKSPNSWAALGVLAGSLWYDNNLVVSSTASKLNRLPTYFICGTSDDLLEDNKNAYNLLEGTGNPNIKFVTFNGGHEYHVPSVETMYIWMREFVNNNLEAGLSDPQETSQLVYNIRNFPNPVNTTTFISYTVDENIKVNICIYDIYGSLVNELINEVKTKGDHYIVYDASNLISGIYPIKMKAGNIVAETKMFVIK